MSRLFQIPQISPHTLIEVLDLDFVNCISRASSFMICLWKLLWIEETHETIEGFYVFCREFIRRIENGKDLRKA